MLLSAAVLATVPLRLSVRADISREPTFEAVLYVYGVRMQFEGVIGPKGHLSMRRSDGKSGINLPVRRLLLFWYYLFTGAQWSHAEANCRVGTGDACATALTAGALAALLRAAGAGIGMRVRVWPEFSRVFFALSLRCILSFRGGDIIRAGAKALMKDARKRWGKSLASAGG